MDGALSGNSAAKRVRNDAIPRRRISSTSGPRTRSLAFVTRSKQELNAAGREVLSKRLALLSGRDSREDLSLGSFSNGTRGKSRRAKLYKVQSKNAGGTYFYASGGLFLYGYLSALFQESASCTGAKLEK